MKRNQLLSLVFTALMAAVLCVLAPLSIPLSHIPISLATFVVYISAVLLGWKYSVASVAVYLLIGFVGVPVFAGYKAGASVLAGPTGGYLIGYLFIALFTGLFMKLGKGKLAMTFLGMMIGTAVCYAIGTAWFMMQLHMNLHASMSACVYPFIPGDIIKMVACILITTPVKSQIDKYILA